ncbi:MAG TPA: 4Fe-4S dicluster domain-containing protein [Steroidobacteraceae bacterium]|nr:4Fe-4S dicluster domain-containing protein [Steroidobacteraceae bacterium]
MGHLVGKDVYGSLGRKIDDLTVRTPQTETFRRMLRALYTAEEADLVVRMPFALSTLERIARVTGCEPAELEPRLAALCDKGLVIDILLGDRYRYMPAPFVIGMFEFTMMRMRGDEPDIGRISRLFLDYFHEGDFYAANFRDGQRVSVARTLPHLDDLGDHVEILDYERVERIIDEADSFSIGACSCRHAKHHAGQQTCKVPLETCTSFGRAADYLVRHGMARPIDRSEMRDVAQRSKDLKLVFSVDNVKEQPAFLCHCCGCCCDIMEGINRHGYPNAIVSSTLMPQVDMESCNGCQKCGRACHVSAISMVPDPMQAGSKRMFKPVIDEDRCIGCGVCGLVCDPDAIRMVKRAQHVIHPETTFERVILQCLERGTLQNQLFDEPDRVSHQVMRGIVGGFLRLSPVKKALMSDTLRSRFLASLGAAAAARGGNDVLRM